MISYIFGLKGKSGFGSSSTADQVADTVKDHINNKVVLITGANTGIGKETARVLAARGAHVIMACRDPQRMQKASEDIKKLVPNAKITEMVLDLSSLESIKQFSLSFLTKGLPLHVLINNAGVMACPLTSTKDGLENQIGCNVVGHYLLTELLLPQLKKTGTPEQPARVVCVSSEAHKIARNGIPIDNPDLLSTKNSKYSAWLWYGYSKLGNIYHARVLNQRMIDEKANVRAYSLHPGAIYTELGRHTWYIGGIMKFNPFSKSIPQGSATSVYCAFAPGIQDGEYYSDANVAYSTPVSKDMKKATDFCAFISKYAKV
eukprot:NODE_4576_length_1146_cov_88.697947_g4058_i0.p1 GENE.NODE_4576_length_1146_cov_88.697947_g4058_i0~~NODE_4576_length_1146_cov_88.697947_g4058_i0.p1  ORF type:complete len:317 (-),score=57.45 NODE_4576_length_1146_cov_88.697947_g4058_i0:141-1091(-)